ncbi:MAG: metallophosphoesterase, partial [Planctomycetota bacterium]
VTSTPLFTFAVVGDTRINSAKPDTTRLNIVNKIAELKPAFVVNTGDLVFNGGDRDDWKGFDKLNKVFRDNAITYYPALGNHDYRGDDGEKDALNNYFQRFPQINRQRWYAFTHTNCAFIVLDTNFSDLSKEQIKQETNWLGETVAKYQADKDISFIFAFFHHPPYTNGTSHNPDEAVQQKFVPIFAKSSKIKFVFAGHVHTYERFRMNNINYIVTGGGGASLASILSPEKWRFKDEYDKNGDKPRGYNFCQMIITNNSAELRTYHLITPKKNEWAINETLKEPLPETRNSPQRR